MRTASGALMAPPPPVDPPEEECDVNQNGTESECSARSSTLRCGPILFDRSQLLEPPYENYDALVTFNGRPFPLHRTIVAPVSLYLEQVLSSDWAEGRAGGFHADIPGAEDRHVAWVLRAVYGAEDALEPRDVEGVLAVARYFQVGSLETRIQDVVCGYVRSVPEVLGLNITDPVILNRIAGTLDLSTGSVTELHDLLCRASHGGAGALQERVGVLLADALISPGACMDELAQLPFAALTGCFSADVMNHMPDEDAVLSLLQRVCAAHTNLSSEEERKLAGCVRLEYLTVAGQGRARNWPAVDRDQLINAILYAREALETGGFGASLSPKGVLQPRKFLLAFSPTLSHGPLTFSDFGREVVHTVGGAQPARAVAVVDAPDGVEVTFELLQDRLHDESTCFGVVARDEAASVVDHRSALGPVWRAYSGKIRADNRACGPLRPQKLHPNDHATVRIDSTTHTVEFRKNGFPVERVSISPKVVQPRPAVWFYGSGECVRVHSASALLRAAS